MHVLSYILHIIFRGIKLNESIVPYIPIADRVEATNEKSMQLCQQLFRLIDSCVRAQIAFNHDTERGYLSISPDQINDLLQEISKNDRSVKLIDINLLKESLNNLIYPKFNGELTLTSPIWNNEHVTVWQFQLNQIANGVSMQQINNDAELCLDMVMGSIRVWRNSLEASAGDKDVIYNNQDLIYKLLDIEEKLKVVQTTFEE